MWQSSKMQGLSQHRSKRDRNEPPTQAPRSFQRGKQPLTVGQLGFSPSQLEVCPVQPRPTCEGAKKEASGS